MGAYDGLTNKQQEQVSLIAIGAINALVTSVAEMVRAEEFEVEDFSALHLFPAEGVDGLLDKLEEQLTDIYNWAAAGLEVLAEVNP